MLFQPWFASLALGETRCIDTILDRGKEYTTEALVFAHRLGFQEIVDGLTSDIRMDNAWGQNRILQYACVTGQLNVVNELILRDRGVNVAADKNAAIRSSSLHGHTDIVRRLIETRKVYPSARQNEAIRLASREGHAAIVRLLLQEESVDPSDSTNEAVISACENGHDEVVQLLLEDGRANPSARRNRALRLASQNGHASIVRRLLQDDRVDPADEDNDAIRLAKDPEVLRLLLEDDRVLKPRMKQQQIPG